jgi:hypothetical protein
MERGEKEKGVLLRLSEKMRYLFPQASGRGGRSISISSLLAPDG